MKKNTNRIVSLDILQRMLISACTHLNRPIRKSQLITMLVDLFEYNTPKQVDFALLELLEEGKLCQKGYFIVTPEFAAVWNGIVTTADEAVIRFFLSLKEEAKKDLFFDVYAKESLSPNCFFKYIGAKYPALLRRQDAAFAYMEQLEDAFRYGLNSSFYMEMNDYPTDRWLTVFLNNPDCRIFVKNIYTGRNYASIQVMLIPSKNRSYKKAYTDYAEFRKNMPAYFKDNIKVQIKKSLTVIPFGSRKKR